MKQKILLALGCVLLTSGAWATDYTLTLYADGCDSPNTFICSSGQQLSVSATPMEHRRFVKWNDGNTDNPRLVTMNRNLTYTATFAPRSTSQADGNAEVSSSSGRTSCEYVQLWEGGPKWATFNVGATITDPDYINLTVGADATPFAHYTDQAPYYNTANCGGLYAWNQPNYNGRKTTWKSSVTTGVADVATTLWGSNWKTPTRQQLDTLQNSSYGKTIWTWCDGSTTQYVPGCTLKGYKVSGVGEYADKCIFLPAAGCFHYRNGTVDNASYYGLYWSSSKSDSYTAYYLSFDSSPRRMSISIREDGRSVRAVLVEEGATALEDLVSPTTGVQKIFRDGQVLILRDGVIYDTTGRMVEK